MGRKKLEIRKITNNKFRYVTFTKRRIGLFKKAAELALLCSSKVTIKIEDEFGNMSQFTSDRKFLQDESKQPFHAVFPIEEYPEFKNFIMTDEKGRVSDSQPSTPDSKQTTSQQNSEPRQTKQVETLPQIIPTAYGCFLYPFPNTYLQS